MDPGAEPKLARRVGQVSGIDRVLEEGLDARDEDARPAAAPGGERRHPGRGLVSDQLAPFVGQRGARFQHRDGLGITEPRAELLGHPVADLGVAGDPDEPLAIGRQREGRREIALGTVRDSHQADMPAGPSRVVPGTPQALAEGRERAGGGEQWREHGQVRDPLAATLPTWRRRRAGRRPARAGRAAVESPAPRASSTSASTAAVSKSTASSAAGAAWRAAKSVATRSAIRRSRPRRPRIGVSGMSGVRLGGADAAPAGPRPADPSASGGPSTSPGAASRVVSAGRSSNMLKRLAALLVPSRAQSSTASAAASRSSSRRCCSSGAKRVRTWSTASGPARRSRPAAG